MLKQVEKISKKLKQKSKFPLTRINQHVASNICNGKMHRCMNTYGILIAEHLVKKQQSAWSYNQDILCSTKGN